MLLTILAAAIIFEPARRRLKQLQQASVRLGTGDLSARAPESGGDEVALVASSFNRMAEEIRFHTENLERLVEERTGALAKANEEITALNTRLKSENLRLGAELDVARQIQMMVMPI